MALETEIVTHSDFKAEFDAERVAYPLYSVNTVVIEPACSAAIDVNIVNIRLPHGTFGWIMDDKYLIGGGVIDEDYRGVVKVIVINNNSNSMMISSGERVAFMAIVKYGTTIFMGGTATKAHETDAGYDVCCREDFVIPPFGKYVVKSGLFITTNPNNPFMVHSRSGLSLKKCIIARGDSDTDDGLAIELTNHSSNEVSFAEGDKVAQVVVHVVEHFRHTKTTIVEKIDTQTKRGTGGFGSTDAIKESVK